MGWSKRVELPEHPFGLAVQWHPEWLTDQRWHAKVYLSAFVEAAT